MRVLLCAVLAVSVWGQTGRVTGRIEGRVESTTGEPIARASLRVESRAGLQVETATAEGTFAIDAAPGEYFITAGKTGYGVASAPTRVVEGATARIVLRLEPRAVITGRVIDQYGDPVTNQQVMALRRAWAASGRALQRATGATTDDRGVFRLADLTPGQYLLLADGFSGPLLTVFALPAAGGPRPDIGAAPTFYPSEIDASRATVIDAQAGEETSGIVIQARVSRPFSVRGTLTDAVTGAPLWGAVSAYLRDQRDFSRAEAKVGRAGDEFEFKSLAPGDYTLHAVVNVPDGAGDLRTLSGSIDVVVTGDMSGVDLRLAPHVDLRGFVAMEDGSALPLPGELRTGKIEAGTARTDTRFGSVNDDGSFRLGNVPPGLHTFSFTGTPRGAYVKSVKSGGVELAGALLDITRGGPGELEIVLANDLAELTVAGEAAGEGRRAMLWPKRARPMLSGFGISGGSVMHVPPGEYYLAVFDDIGSEQTSYAYLSLFNGLATEVTLEPNAKVTAEAAYISGEKVEEIVRGAR